MGARKRETSKDREQAMLDRAERVFALRLMRMLNADGALPLEPVPSPKYDPERAQNINSLESRPRGRRANDSPFKRCAEMTFRPPCNTGSRPTAPRG